MAHITTKDFFGGAIRGIVPHRWIDGSDLREVPDHQELFLSPDTLSTFIIEINQRVSKEEALSTFATFTHQHPGLSTASSGTATAGTAETINQAAALYHLNDLCDEGDAMEIVTPPTRVVPTSLSASAPPGSSISAFEGIVQYLTTGRRRGTSGAVTDSAVAGASIDGPSGEGAKVSKVTCHYLLVRLEAQETDLLAFFNVPHKEFDEKGDAQGLSREEGVAESFMASLVDRLEIRDWGLFV
ncbi:hypothetical protein N7539_006340 [Penicillium diatomitis]|uniref:Ran-interacting protein Mog1 n=1 Tax=Penicillium diatomitis TaxID=2819901 RepID=A0A9W9X2X6_9EURO|nr:uncharacterized protein N7539_006340 [Penicillium diatomitis]KAJ5482894.1 hypothetical protein N7539_006340 [Penicillium diatomitis]